MNPATVSQMQQRSKIDLDTTIVNFRYTFLPIPVILAVPVQKNEWRTLPILAAALNCLSKEYGQEIQETWVMAVPSALVVRLEQHREKARVNDILLTPRVKNELSSSILRDAGGIYAYVQEHNDAVIDISQRSVRPAHKFPTVQLASVLGAAVVVHVFLGGPLSFWGVIQQLLISALGGYLAMVMTCRCKVVVR
ncbi:hypothetical protein HDU87_000481 [Geranomyces variabilis]|uniref:Uncharacterized protein n=1 Tax=Geranomyces variabilis TaxID=109894 RepID=A0AAD5TDG2_9FUNG|nr:hypothetical protein HDU87_000481 [Geranomyces variabilis]